MHSSRTTVSGSVPGDWDLPTPEEVARGRELARVLALPDVAGQILVRRGLHSAEEAERALQLSSADLHDPHLLPDLEDASRRLVRAIEAGERIVVHGDYDADGVCGTALLTRGLRRLGARVEPFVPDRHRDGYGVADRLIDHIASAGVGVLITVDTGSSAGAQFRRAREAGIDVIVCDHHRFDGRPEGARFFINPLRDDSGYPHRDLCGAAIAQKLLAAVSRARGGDANPGLDLAAIATIADLVPLGRENRAIARLGLDDLAHRPSPGVAALLEKARIGRRRLEGEDVAFQIAPRINAAGRIERARSALDLLLCDDPAEARQLAGHVEDLNHRRRDLDRRVAEEALALGARRVAEENPAGLVLASEEWHRGVVGIAAAKIVREFGRPAMLFALEGEIAVGSARSVAGVDLKAALDDCDVDFHRYGGHAAAAGATLASADIPRLATAFAAAVARTGVAVTAHDLRVDGVLGSGDLTAALADFLWAFGPYGSHRPAPRIAALGMQQRTAPRVVGDNHLKLDLDGDGRALDMIGFGRAKDWLATVHAASHLDVSFHLRHRPDSRFSEWEMSLHGLRGAIAAEGESV